MQQLDPDARTRHMIRPGILRPNRPLGCTVPPWYHKVNEAEGHFIANDKGDIICRLHERFAGPGDWRGDYQTLEANANLIIAAPDLLAALQNLVALIPDQGGYVGKGEREQVSVTLQLKDTQHFRNIARAAIRKATTHTT